MLVLRASRFRSRFFLSKEALGTRMKIGNGNVNDLLANRIVILNFGSKMAAELEAEPLIQSQNPVHHEVVTSLQKKLAKVKNVDS